MNKSINMKNYFKTIASAMAIFALVFSVFATPLTTVTAETLNVGSSSSNSSSAESSSSSVTTCNITANRYTVTTGDSVTVNWSTSGFTNITINGEVVSGNSGSRTYTNLQVSTIFKLEATNNSGSKCVQQVTVNCVPPVHTFCELEVTKIVDKSSASVGDNLTYTINVKNDGTADCTGDGVFIADPIDPNLTYISHTISSNLIAGYGYYPVFREADRTLYFNGGTLTPGEVGTITWVGKVKAPVTCGDFEVKNQAKATAKELNNFNTWAYSQTVKTNIDNDCHEPLAPTCDSFTANPTAIILGGKSTLSWQTTNATQVIINNGIGAVALDGTIEVSPLANTTYRLTAIAGDKTVNCEVPVTVSLDPVPVCELFTATPNQLGVGGGNVTLNWRVTNATEVSISPTVGIVGLTGTTVTPVTQSTTFILKAKDSNGDEVSCSAPVTVSDPGTPFTCSNNVNFTVSDSSIRRGDNTTLNWSTTNVDTVSISVIDATSLSGSKTVSPSSDTTYTLTATKGSQTIDCPLSVDVSSGGGGGGTPTPRCELDISDAKIKRGEEITIKWNTSNATEVTLKDDKNKVIFTTDDLSSSDKKDYLDGSVKIKPTRDTEYTLLAERGSRDKTCRVKVEVEDGVVVLQTRDQQPLVTGISLSEVPYTGFEAGPVMTVMFYLLLGAWASYIAYLLIMRKQMVNAKNNPIMDVPHINVDNHAHMKRAEDTRSDVFVSSISTTLTNVPTTPTNLPTGTPAIGYANYAEAAVNPHQVNDEVVVELENRAHSQKALLSSDAVRYFIQHTEGSLERNATLDLVIAEAKKNYPLEDGWVVINESRMQNLCEVCLTNSVLDKASFTPSTVPKGSGSLAEAIVIGNIVSAYEMIGNRPMFALADAAADLDALYRYRKGETVKISDLLITETAELSEEKIKNMITALTGAIDGTYTDEASAVKMAIMKAVKEIV